MLARPTRYTIGRAVDAGKSGVSAALVLLLKYSHNFFDCTYNALVTADVPAEKHGLRERRDVPGANLHGLISKLNRHKEMSSHAREQGDEIEKGGSAGALDRNQIDDAIMTMSSVYSSMRNPKVMKQGSGRGDRRGGVALYYIYRHFDRSTARS